MSMLQGGIMDYSSLIIIIVFIAVMFLMHRGGGGCCGGGHSHGKKGKNGEAKGVDDRKNDDHKTC